MPKGPAETRLGPPPRAQARAPSLTRKIKKAGSGTNLQAASESNTPGTANAAAGATGGSKPSKKSKLEEFYKQFETDGINRKTIQDIIRAQLAWRDVIRRQYGPRLASLFSALPNTDEKPTEATFNSMFAFCGSASPAPTRKPSASA